MLAEDIGTPDQAPRLASPDEVPVLDLTPLNEGGDLRPLAARLRKACRDTAFFYIVNHGVPDAVMNAAIEASRRFFEAPEGVRLGVLRNRYNRGYLPIGTTRLPGQEPDLKDSFDLGVDLPLNDPDVLSETPFHGPNQWPDLPQFRPAVEGYFESVRALGLRLLRPFALALDLDEEYFIGLYSKPTLSMRFLHYPRPGDNEHRLAVGASTHTDYGVVTILYQDPAGGLELQKPDGEWVAAPFIPGTFVINIGDLMARWTNDLFRSNPHRVVNRTGRERFSIAAFFNPSYRTEVACLPTCTRPDNPPKHPPVGAGEYVMEKIKANQFRYA
jgi:isopenicillin N synthase-like dioxygenase